MNITQTQAVKMFRAIGFVSAEEWDLEKLNRVANSNQVRNYPKENIEVEVDEDDKETRALWLQLINLKEDEIVIVS